MRNTVWCSAQMACSRSLGVLSGQRSSSSWVVTKYTSRSSLTRRLGKATFNASLVSHTAATMARTVAFRYASFRSSREMIFSQSHWST